RVPVPEALAMLGGRYDSVATVSEADIIRAMRIVHERLGLVAEPAGAVGVAAILGDPDRFRERRVATLLCGSNVSAAQMRDWLSAP
ncbi:MAG TPA: pyridoxal-phosphate dependent enzyme, partial [Alphaproteobacteria bacterium]|nr:pyridoxal-phosphate dependent enzyme [Alphaproteobacteria bacterium]